MYNFTEHSSPLFPYLPSNLGYLYRLINYSQNSLTLRETHDTWRALDSWAWGLAINLDLDQVSSIWRLLSPNSCSVASVKWGGGFRPVSWQLSSSQRALPQLALIGSLASSLCKKFIESFLSSSFSSPPSLSSFLFLLSASCLLPFPFLLCLTSRWPEERVSSSNSWGKNVLTPHCALCQGLQRDQRQCSYLPQYLSSLLQP